RHEFVLLRNVRLQPILDQVVADGRGNGQKQAGGRRQGGSETASGDKADDPAGQLRDFRIGQNEYVVVDRQFVASPAALGSRGGKAFGLVVVVLNTTVAVLVLELQQARHFPGIHPVGTLVIKDRLLLRAGREDCVD